MKKLLSELPPGGWLFFTIECAKGRAEVEIERIDPDFFEIREWWRNRTVNGLGESFQTRNSQYDLHHASRLWEHIPEERFDFGKL